MSKRGYYLGGHTIIDGTSSWFKNPAKRKKGAKRNPRVKMKRKPRAKLAPVLSARELKWRRSSNALRWASQVLDFNEALANPNLSAERRTALLKVMAEREWQAAMRQARRWAALVASIPRALARKDLTEAQRAALLERRTELRRLRRAASD